VRFVFDEINKGLEEQLEGHIDALSWGKPESFEQYAEMVGVIAGIRKSIRSVEDVYEMMLKQEED
jgi:hypothetical protein